MKGRRAGKRVLLPLLFVSIGIYEREDDWMVGEKVTAFNIEIFIDPATQSAGTWNYNDAAQTVAPHQLAS